MMQELLHPPIPVVRPFLPPIEEYHGLLSKLWESKILTNNGSYHQKLEDQICKLLGINNLSLVNNGTSAIEIAIQALGLKGKVITTPYSFVATSNAILLKGLEPVFIDIQDDGYNIDSELIDVVFDSEVCAIMPVHVYGIPCDHAIIDKVTSPRNLKVIYDAAHAFGVRLDGKSILNWGDASTLSFHATKVFHTFEGGAIVCNDPQIKQRIEEMKNFGFSNGDVVSMGTNGKMNEAQAAMGLVLLNHQDEIRTARKKWHDLYIEQLHDIPGIKMYSIPNNVEHNYAYFPILVTSGYPLTRDQLFEKFQEQEIYPRKYFYPLITDFSLYRNYPIISKHKIPNARKVADSVICLPLYPDLSENDVTRVCDVIRRQ